MNDEKLKSEGLVIGENSMYFYETRHDWDNYSPDKYHLKVVSSRRAPLGGQYAARVPATTALQGGLLSQFVHVSYFCVF